MPPWTSRRLSFRVDVDDLGERWIADADRDPRRVEFTLAGHRFLDQLSCLILSRSVPEMSVLVDDPLMECFAVHVGILLPQNVHVNSTIVSEITSRLVDTFANTSERIVSILFVVQVLRRLVHRPPPRRGRIALGLDVLTHRRHEYEEQAGDDDSHASTGRRFDSP